MPNNSLASTSCIKTDPESAVSPDDIDDFDDIPPSHTPRLVEPNLLWHKQSEK